MVAKGLTVMVKGTAAPRHSCQLLHAVTCQLHGHMSLLHTMVITEHTLVFPSKKRYFVGSNFDKEGALHAAFFT